MTEEAVMFGPNSGLCGVLSRPAHIDPNVPAFLLLNAGYLHHVGPNRLYVNVARAFAERGIPVLRFDFAGFGDSVGRARELGFEERALEDVRYALDDLEARIGTRKFVLSGICLGAELSVKTALLDRRVIGTALLNAGRYFAEPEGETAEYLDRASAGHYYWRVAVFNPASWGRLLRGQVDYRAISQAVASRVRLVNGAGAGLSEVDPCEEDIKGFCSIVERGVRILFVMSEGDRARDYVRALLPRIEGREPGKASVGIAVMDHSDHLFTTLDSQQRLLQRLSDWFDGIVAR